MNKPCLCASCPECGSLFWATVIHEDFLTDADNNKHKLAEAARYFSEGYKITVIDADDLKLKYCEHLKTDNS